MSSVSLAKDATQLQDVESVIEAIRRMVKLLDCVVLVGAADPEVSGILSAEGETFREVLPLGDGVHIVLSLGSLPTKFVDGIHEVEV
jgi:uncharacterized linocin/CFP29 family protein